jgi:hypothetical protein
MSLASDLLAQATELARRDKNKPKQASLRRAISTAYYALFHLLTLEASKEIAPANPPKLQRQIQRAFDHGTMKQACQAFAKNFSGSASRQLPTSLIPSINAELRRLASAFVALQEARHKADYDLLSDFNRLDALQECQRAKDAFDAWETIKGTTEANVFLCALVFWKQWSR